MKPRTWTPAANARFTTAWEANTPVSTRSQEKKIGPRQIPETPGRHASLGEVFRGDDGSPRTVAEPEAARLRQKGTPLSQRAPALVRGRSSC